MSEQLPNDGVGGGTYSTLYLTKQSSGRILSWAKKAGIYDAVLKQHQDGGFHITICYSRLPVQFTALGSLPPLPVKPKGFELFGKEKEYLVLEVTSNFAINRNEYARIIGAISDFEDYKPHVSLAKDAGITSVKGIPPIDFLLFIDREEVSKINPDR